MTEAVDPTEKARKRRANEMHNEMHNVKHDEKHDERVRRAIERYRQLVGNRSDPALQRSDEPVAQRGLAHDGQPAPADATVVAQKSDRPPHWENGR